MEAREVDLLTKEIKHCKDELNVFKSLANEKDRELAASSKEIEKLRHINAIQAESLRVAQNNCSDLELKLSVESALRGEVEITNTTMVNKLHDLEEQLASAATQEQGEFAWKSRIAGMERELVSVRGMLSEKQSEVDSIRKEMENALSEVEALEAAAAKAKEEEIEAARRRAEQIEKESKMTGVKAKSAYFNRQIQESGDVSQLNAQKIKDEAARRRAIKEARRKQSSISASLIPSRGRTQSADDGADLLSPTTPSRTASAGEELPSGRSSSIGGNDRDFRASIMSDDGDPRLSDLMMDSDYRSHTAQEYAEELQERDEMLAEKGAEIESLKELLVTLKNNCDELRESSAEDKKQLHLAKLSVEETCRLLQIHYGLIARGIHELKQCEQGSIRPNIDCTKDVTTDSQRVTPAGPTPSDSIGSQEEKSTLTPTISRGRGDTNSGDSSIRSKLAELTSERDEAVQDARRLRFRLDDQDVVWKVRLEAVQEDLTAHKNKLTGKELALEILIKERDDALAEVGALKQAIAGMFDSMSDPYSASPAQTSSIVDELQGSGKKDKPRVSPLPQLSSERRGGGEEDENQWMARMDEMQRKLENATRRRSVKEQQVDSIIDDLDKDRNVTLDQKVAQRRMSQRLENVEPKLEQVTHTVGSSFVTPPVKEAKHLTSVASAWNASSGQSEVSSESPSTPEVASVSNTSTTMSSRMSRPQRRLSVEESHAALTDLETKLSRISRRPSLMADTAGINIEAQSMVYEALVVDHLEEDDIVKYKVVVRALGDIEWTIYRRYSEFRELFSSVLVMTSVEFDTKFPKKNRDSWINPLEAPKLKRRQAELKAWLMEVVRFSNESVRPMGVTARDIKILKNLVSLFLESVAHVNPSKVLG